MEIVHINNITVPELAPYTRLTERQLQNRLHPEKGLFICESMKVIRVALERGLRPVSFLCEEKFIETLPDTSATVYTAPRGMLKELTGYELSRGVLCAMQRPRLLSVEELINDVETRLTTCRVAVIDSVVNSENIGAIFRAAASLGIDAVLLSRTCCDPLNRRACRVSMGTVFQLPWTFLDSYTQLKNSGFTIVALALTNDSVPIDSPVLKSIDRMAIVMGTEGDGLSDNVLRMADHVVKIPMQRGVDSLNVAAAAAVAFWELGKPPAGQG